LSAKRANSISVGDGGGGYKLLGDIAELKVETVSSPATSPSLPRPSRGGPAAVSNFLDYAGPLTETVLLGNLVVWAGKKIEWDAKNQKATNAPEVEAIVRHEHRKGYAL
jgi:hypothetical protein